jgi:hypothetical protein
VHAVAGVLPGEAGAVGGTVAGPVLIEGVGAVVGWDGVVVWGADVAGILAIVGAAVDGAGVTRTVSGKHPAAAKVSTKSAASKREWRFICTQ